MWASDQADGWRSFDVAPPGGDYIWLREPIRSGRARGTVRELVGWAIRSNVGTITCWRWVDGQAGALGDIDRVRAEAWAPYTRPFARWEAMLPAVSPGLWSIGRDEAEERVLTAIKTARATATPRPRGFACGWANMAHETIATGADYDEEHERFIPRPVDISDCPVALAWFGRLATPARLEARGRSREPIYEQRLMMLRAAAPGRYVRSTADMARTLKRSPTIIAAHYTNTVTELWRIANGMEVLKSWR